MTYHYGFLATEKMSKIKLRMTSFYYCRETYYMNTLSIWVLKVRCCHSIVENMDSIVFYTATERSLFDLRR